MQNIFGFLQNGAVYVIACVLLLSILIFVHELGHFLVARACGVRVEVFSLGFGKHIWKKTVGDTTYALSLFPIGGYVKMFGEQPGAEIAPEDKSVSFTHKKVSQRIAIVLAGPLMNLFFAAVVFTAVAMIGVDYRAPILGDIEAGTAAATAGFQSGDKIMTVAGKPVQTYDDVADAMDEARGRNLNFQVLHSDGQTADIFAEIKSRPNPNPLSTQDAIGDVDGFTSLARAPIVGVPATSPLYAMGLRTGDRIVAVNGKKLSYLRDLNKAFKAIGSGILSLDVERDHAGAPSEKLAVTLAAGGAIGGPEGLKLESSDLYLDKVFDDSPAKKAGLQAGDRLVALNGKTITRWEDVLQTIKGYSGQGGVAVDFIREGEAKSLKLEPQVTTQMTGYGTEDKRYTIGVSPTVEAAMPEVINVQVLNPVMALARGAQQSWDFSVLTLMSFVRLFQSKISPKTLGGVLSIGQAAGETMKLGLGKFLTMMGIISINLFVLNLLPVPVLDGGHLVFYTIEAVKGSPVSLRKMEIAQQVGIVLLAGLMVFALFNDVTRLIFGRI